MTSDLRSELEKELHDVVIELQDMLISPTIGREKFRDALGRLRIAKIHLDNKRWGCHSGHHAGACTCKPEIPGYSTDGSGKVYVPRKKAAS